jgi:hypothetical protein
MANWKRSVGVGTQDSGLKLRDPRLADALSRHYALHVEDIQQREGRC